jgi:hypothetical protein
MASTLSVLERIKGIETRVDSIGKAYDKYVEANHKEAEIINVALMALETRIAELTKKVGVIEVKTTAPVKTPPKKKKR